MKELRETHSIAFFVYYVIIGIVLKSIVERNFLGGLLFFLPLVFHTTLGAASLKDIHRAIIKRRSLKVLLSASPVIGVLIASLFVIPIGVNHALLAFISGVFLFVVIREVIPKESKGDPMDFILGMLVYSLLIIFTWLV